MGIICPPPIGIGLNDLTNIGAPGPPVLASLPICEYFPLVNVDNKKSHMAFPFIFEHFRTTEVI